MDVPETFITRHPFPGPGLAVRVLGDVTEGNALNVLRDVDEIFIDTIREFGLYDKIWQAFAVFLPVRSVGVQGDQRTHSHVVALRAVTSGDGMTADWYPFETDFLKEVSNRICNRVGPPSAHAGPGFPPSYGFVPLPLPYMPPQLLSPTAWL